MSPKEKLLVYLLHAQKSGAYVCGGGQTHIQTNTRDKPLRRGSSFEQGDRAVVAVHTWAGPADAESRFSFGKRTLRKTHIMS